MYIPDVHLQTRGAIYQSRHNIKEGQIQHCTNSSELGELEQMFR